MATCSIEGCEKPGRQRTWCAMHYQRWRIHGDLDRGYQTPIECARCSTEKHRNASGKLYCRKCAANFARAWRAENADAIRVRKRERYERNKDAVLERTAAYYRANRANLAAASDAWRKANPDRVRRYKRAWVVKNPAKGLEYANQRRALKLSAVCEHGPGCVTAETYKEIRSGRCVYCDAPARHADHVTPLTRDGLHCRENLVPACAHCNQSKGNCLPDEWLARTGAGVA